MKISQEDVILIKNLYLSRRVLSELPDKRWKLGSIDSLLNRSHKTGRPIVPKPGSGRPRSSVRRTSQKSIGHLVRFRMKLPFSIQVYTEK